MIALYILLVILLIITFILFSNISALAIKKKMGRYIQKSRKVETVIYHNMFNRLCLCEYLRTKREGKESAVCR